MSDVDTKDGPATTEQRFRRLNPFWKWLLIALSVASILFSAYQVFNLGRYTGYVPIENQYFYAIVALLLPTAFIVFPLSGKSGHDGMTWYDILLFLATGGICLVFVYF